MLQISSSTPELASSTVFDSDKVFETACCIRKYFSFVFLCSISIQQPIYPANSSSTYLGTPLSSIHKYSPSEFFRRYSISNLSRLSKASQQVSIQNCKSSGRTPSLHPVPVSCSRVLPVKSTQPLLK